MLPRHIPPSQPSQSASSPTPGPSSASLASGNTAWPQDLTREFPLTVGITAFTVPPRMPAHPALTDAAILSLFRALRDTPARFDFVELPTANGGRQIICTSNPFQPNPLQIALHLDCNNWLQTVSLREHNPNEPAREMQAHFLPKPPPVNAFQIRSPGWLAEVTAASTGRPQGRKRRIPPPNPPQTHRLRRAPNATAAPSPAPDNAPAVRQRAKGKTAASNAPAGRNPPHRLQAQFRAAQQPATQARSAPGEQIPSRLFQYASGLACQHVAALAASLALETYEIDTRLESMCKRRHPPPRNNRMQESGSCCQPAEDGGGRKGRGSSRDREEGTPDRGPNAVGPVAGRGGQRDDGDGDRHGR